MKNKFLSKIIVLFFMGGLTSCSLWDPTYYENRGNSQELPDDSSIVLNVTEEDLKVGLDSGTIISFFNPITGNDSGYLQSLVNLWNRKFGKSYFINATSNTEATHYQKIDNNINSSTAPDLAIVHNSYVSYYQHRNNLRDITTMMSDVGIKEEDYVDNTYVNGVYDGKLYALIYDLIPTFLFYNKTLLNELGYSEEEVLAEDFTVDKMMEMSKKAYVHNTVLSKIRYGFAFNYAFTEQPFLNFLYQQDGSVVSISSPKRAKFNEARGYKAAEALKKISNTYTDDGYRVSQVSGDDHIDVFSMGRALFTIDGIWQEENLLLHNDKVETGITFFPKVSNESMKRNTFANSHSLACFSNKTTSSVKDVGLKYFMKFLVDNSAYWCQGGKVAVRKDALESETYKSLPWAFVSNKMELLAIPERVYTYTYLIKKLPEYVSLLCENGGDFDACSSAVDNAAREGETLAKNL
ncbi:MAG: extracellular solute-binding protein [Bacilli bacterium]|nr:extracellular solute-binding protein [Bacilli bacterium]